MAFTTIAYVALILSIIAIVKMIILYMFPNVTRKQVKHITKTKHHGKFYAFLSFIIFLAIFYLLIREINIFQIYVGIVLGCLLMYMMINPYHKTADKLYHEIIKDPHKTWFVFLIILLISLWILYISLF